MDSNENKILNSAIFQTAKSVDADLIQINSHNTICKICMQYEGKIYSLSGKDKDFPKLIDIPPFHDGCRHVATIVFKEALKIDGTLSKYIDFSNGRSEIHPTLHGFIPISKRLNHNFEYELKLRKNLLSILKKLDLRKSKLKQINEKSKAYININNEISNLLIEKNNIEIEIKKMGSWFKLIRDLEKRYFELTDKSLNLE